MLEDFSTKDLVTELIAREGIETIIAEPYENKTVTVNGSAIILIIID